MSDIKTSAKLHDRLRETADNATGFKGEYFPKAARELLYEAADELEALQREHEFICRKCGLRQDNPNQIEGNF